MGLTTDFLAHPAQFAGIHTLYPYADPVTNAAHQKHLSLNDGTAFTQVGGDNKIAYLEIKPASAVPSLPSDCRNSAVGYANSRDLWVMRVTYTNPGGDAVPCYYLPWEENHMLRIKLKPSRKHPKTEGWLWWKKEVDPVVFVTAALQGCSVMVSGEAAAPVVYHVNAQSVNGVGGSLMGNDAAFDIAAAAKKAHMKALVAAARDDVRKEGPVGATGTRPAPGTFPIRRTHLKDYAQGNRPTENAALVNHYSHYGTNLLVGRFGTVFGVRNGGTWEFYRQRRTWLCYDVPPTNKTEERWVDPVCVRFWP